MAATSDIRFIFELPVPVTAFIHTTEIDINTNALDTTRNTGMAAVIKSSPWPYIDKNKCGKIFRKIQTSKAKPKLQYMIRLINCGTLWCRFCPITLLTIVLAVAANAQVKQPKNPKILRMV